LVDSVLYLEAKTTSDVVDKVLQRSVVVLIAAVNRLLEIGFDLLGAGLFVSDDLAELLTGSRIVRPIASQADDSIQRELNHLGSFHVVVTSIWRSDGGID
jgi:hypothetical protein